MKPIRSFLGTLLWLSIVSISSGQEMKAATRAAAPPKLLVLVQQEVQLGRTSERRKLLATISRACDRLDAPSFWIDLQSLTGTRETLTFDPFDTSNSCSKPTAAGSSSLPPILTWRRHREKSTPCLRASAPSSPCAATIWVHLRRRTLIFPKRAL